MCGEHLKGATSTSGAKYSYGFIHIGLFLRIGRRVVLRSWSQFFLLLTYKGKQSVPSAEGPCADPFNVLILLKIYEFFGNCVLRKK